MQSAMQTLIAIERCDCGDEVLLIARVGNKCDSAMIISPPGLILHDSLPPIYANCDKSGKHRILYHPIGHRGKVLLYK